MAETAGVCIIVLHDMFLRALLEGLRLHTAYVAVDHAHLLLLLLHGLLVVLLLEFGQGWHTVLHVRLVLVLVLRLVVMTGGMRILLCILTSCSIALMASQSITPLLFEPIKVVIVLEAFSVEKIFEDGPESIVVWPLFKSKSPDRLHVYDELIRNF